MTSAVVVDDDPDVRDLVASVLGLVVDEVTVCATGSEGIALVADGGTDVLVVDLHLSGGLDGARVVAEVRARCGPEVPRILLLTASRDADAVRAAVAAGADLHVQKPFDVEVLLAAVRRLLPGPDQAAKKS